MECACLLTSRAWYGALAESLTHGNLHEGFMTKSFRRFALLASVPLIAITLSPMDARAARCETGNFKGWLDEKAVVLETLTAIHRAGAGIILTYWAKDVARWVA